jgi:hypothetical protein
MRPSNEFDIYEIEDTCPANTASEAESDRTSSMGAMRSSESKSSPTPEDLTEMTTAADLVRVSATTTDTPGSCLASSQITADKENLIAGYVLKDKASALLRVRLETVLSTGEVHELDRMLIVSSGYPNDTACGEYICHYADGSFRVHDHDQDDGGWNLVLKCLEQYLHG